MDQNTSNKDQQIVDLLQNDGKLSYAEIGEAIELSISAVKERVKKLIASGTLASNVYLVNPSAVGIEVCAFVLLQIPDPKLEEGFIRSIDDLPEVQECHCVSGEYAYILKVRTRDIDSLERLLNKRINAIEGVERTNTMISFKVIKERTQLHLTETN